MGNPSHWVHIKCDLGPVGLIQGLVLYGQRPYYRRLGIARSRTCAKASRRGKRSFVRQRQSSIKKDTTAPPSPISCERRDWRRPESTAILTASRSLRLTPSTTLGKSQCTRASKVQRRSRIPLTASNKSSAP